MRSNEQNQPAEVVLRRFVDLLREVCERYPDLRKEFDEIVRRGPTATLPTTRPRRSRHEAIDHVAPGLAER